MTPTLTRIVRDPALRAHPLALQILLVALPDLESGTAVIKVNAMARYLQTTPASVRRAVRWLSGTWITLTGRDPRGACVYTLARKGVRHGPYSPAAPLLRLVA